MKKICSVLLTLCVVLSLAACRTTPDVSGDGSAGDVSVSSGSPVESEVSAEESLGFVASRENLISLYNTASEKEPDSYRAVYDIASTMSYTGVTLDLSVKNTIETTGTGSDDPRVKISSLMSGLLNAETTMTYVGGTVYFSMDPYKFKYSMTVEEFMDEASAEALKPEDFSGIDFIPADDGKAVGTIVCGDVTDTKKALDFLYDMFPAESLGVERSESIDALSYRIDIDADGSLTGEEFAYELTATSSQYGEMKLKITLKYTLDSVGETYIIAAPDDASEYTQVHSGDLISELGSVLSGYNVAERLVINQNEFIDSAYDGDTFSVRKEMYIDLRNAEKVQFSVSGKAKYDDETYKISESYKDGVYSYYDSGDYYDSEATDDEALNYISGALYLTVNGMDAMTHIESEKNEDGTVTVRYELTDAYKQAYLNWALTSVGADEASLASLSDVEYREACGTITYGVSGYVSSSISISASYRAQSGRGEIGAGITSAVSD